MIDRIEGHKKHQQSIYKRIPNTNILALLDPSNSQIHLFRIRRSRMEFTKSEFNTGTLLETNCVTPMKTKGDEDHTKEGISKETRDLLKRADQTIQRSTQNEQKRQAARQEENARRDNRNNNKNKSGS